MVLYLGVDGPIWRGTLMLSRPAPDPVIRAPSGAAYMPMAPPTPHPLRMQGGALYIANGIVSIVSTIFKSNNAV